MLADSANVPELSDLLTKWRKERDRLQTDLETAATCPNGQDTARIAARAPEGMKTLARHINSKDPALSRAAVKELVPKIELWWESDGKRFRRLAKGVISVRYGSSILRDSSSTVSEYLRWEISGP